MRVEILGTRGNVSASARGHSRHSGVLVDDRFLFDVGEREFLRGHPAHIFISHFHPDHVAIRQSDVVWGARCYAPERSPDFPTAIVLTGPIAIGSYRVTPVPTRHSVRCRSSGYVVERRGRRVFYTSDLFGIDRRYHARLQHLDLVITDGSFMRRGGLVRREPTTGKRYGHAGVPELVEFFRRFTPRIVITHFGSWFYRDRARARVKIAELDGADTAVVAARDGMIIRV